jgi:hypothetical protein
MASSWMPPRCPRCQRLSDIIHTSAEEAVRHEIPKASREHLEWALRKVKRMQDKATVRKAIERRLRVLAKKSSSGGAQ